MTTIETTSLTLAATDLTRSEANAPLWRTLKTAARVSAASYPDLRAGGLATAAGYGFTETRQRLDAGSALRRRPARPAGSPPGRGPRAAPVPAARPAAFPQGLPIRCLCLHA